MKHLVLIISVVVLFQLPLSAQPIDTVWAEDWEGDWIENWYVDGGTWEVGIPTYGPDSTYEGLKCAATVLAGNYDDGVRSRLVRLTKFVVPTKDQNPRLRFWHWYSLSSDDHGYLQIKTEHGVWQDISTNYSGTSSDVWTYTSIDLRNYSDSLVQIAFYFLSNNYQGGSVDVSSGWYIDKIQLLVGNYTFNSLEGFENGIGDWYTDRGTWEVGHPTSGPGAAYSGEKCLATVLSGNYQEGMRTYFISPPFRVKPAYENPALRFWHWYSTASADFGRICVKFFNQENWQIISGFSGTSSGVWTLFYADLINYADSIIQIGFYFQSDNYQGGSDDVSSGWYIDDIRIDGISIATVILPENDLAVQWLEPGNKPLCGTLKEQPITVQVENKGANAVSNFKVGYSINGGVNYVYETVFQTIDPGAALEYTFVHKADMTEADSFNCLASVEIPYDVNDTNNITTVTSYNDRLFLDIETTNTECNKATGMAEVRDISGREGPYEIYWTSGNTGTLAENLASGTYLVTITDGVGCSWTEPVIINDIGAPEYSVVASDIKDISCYGRKDGSIYIFPTGGIPPYYYRWSTGATTQDIAGLSKGQYDLTIKDAVGCAQTHSFIIHEPAPINIKSISNNADCGESTGSAELLVSGGTQPYYYNWSSGHFTRSVTGLPGGMYKVIVTDKNECIDSTSVSINELDAPGIIVTSVTPASCGLNDGGINITMASNDYQYNYSWSNGNMTQDIVNAPAGFYNVTVSYKDGTCSSNQVIQIPVTAPAPGTICMVTVDSVTDGNIVVIQEPEHPGTISSYVVQRLDKMGIYQDLGEVNPSVINSITDPTSNSEITSYRYRVKMADYCGNESEPGQFHETMHVIATPDYNLTRANIFWNSYKGVDYNFFKIYRYSNFSGMDVLDTVPKKSDTDFYTYSDLNPPLNDTVYYVIVIELSEPCISSLKATSHNSVRSNKSKNLRFGPENVENIGSLRHLNIYPNPNHGSFRVGLELMSRQDVALRIFDSQGKIIREYYYDNIIGQQEELIEMSEVRPGIYHLQVILNDGMISRSFVIE